MKKFETVLAFDTAMNNCAVAVYAGGRVFGESREMAQGHAEHLLPMAERVLAQAGVKYEDLEALAVTRGPGAFTGLRIGLASAKAMALALDIPLYGITTTQLLALQQVRTQAGARVAVILETKRQDFYIQIFDEQAQEMEPARAGPAKAGDFEGFVLVGDGVERLTGQKAGVCVPDAGLMAEMLTQDPGLFTEGGEPLYLRGADVTESRRPQRILEDPVDIK